MNCFKRVFADFADFRSFCKTVSDHGATVVRIAPDSISIFDRNFEVEFSITPVDSTSIILLAFPDIRKITCAPPGQCGEDSSDIGA